MTGYYCPVEGCTKHTENWEDEQPPFASREAVRSHINAMSDDDHQQARDEGVWKEAPRGGEGTDGEGVEDDNEQANDQQETSDEQANEQPDEGDEESLEEADEMVRPEEYQAQQEGTTSETANSEGVDEQEKSSNDQATDQRGRGSLVPSASPTTYLVIASALLVLFVVWRVYRARQHQPVDLEEDDDTSAAVARDEVPMIE